MVRVVFKFRMINGSLLIYYNFKLRSMPEMVEIYENILLLLSHITEYAYPYIAVLFALFSGKNCNLFMSIYIHAHLENCSRRNDINSTYPKPHLISYRTI